MANMLSLNFIMPPATSSQFHAAIDAICLQQYSQTDHDNKKAYPPFRQPSTYTRFHTNHIYNCHQAAVLHIAALTKCIIQSIPLSTQILQINFQKKIGNRIRAFSISATYPKRTALRSITLFPHCKHAASKLEITDRPDIIYGKSYIDPHSSTKLSQIIWATKSLHRFVTRLPPPYCFLVKHPFEGFKHHTCCHRTSHRRNAFLHISIN
jgi:hypothetical protein